MKHVGRRRIGYKRNQRQELFMKCDNLDGSSSQSPDPIGTQYYQLGSLTSEANQKSEKGAFDTGNLSRITPRRSPLQLPNAPGPKRPIWNPADQQPLSPTYGRNKVETANLLNSEPHRSTEIQRKTGMKLRRMPLKGICKKSPQIYSFDIITPLGLSRPILQYLKGSKKKFTYFTDPLELERHEGLMRKLGQAHILKIRAASSGAAIMAKRLLLSMNFVETSMCRIFYDGLIDIRSEWNLRDHQDPYVREKYGSPATCTRITGTKDWILQPWKL